MNIRKYISTIAGLLTLLFGQSICAENTGNFYGITIIELVNKLAAGALTGRWRADSYHIVTYLSDKGSYAALLDSRQNRKCIAWVVPGSLTEQAVSFGLPPSEQTLKMTAEICMPFTLSFNDKGIIRLVADNPYSPRDGPLSNLAKTMHYDQTQHFIAHIPLVSIDWEMPPFKKHTIEDIRLGPFQGRNPAYSVATGFIMKGNDFGWQADILYAVSTKQHPDKVFETGVFDQSVVERYGSPSTAISGIPDYQKEFYWLFDLQGNKSNIPGRDTCSATFDFWKHKENLAGLNNDIGPWGCSLIMMLTHNGNGVRPRVNVYGIETISGHMAALKHFSTRIEEVAAVRQQIEAVQSFRPKL